MLKELSVIVVAITVTESMIFGFPTWVVLSYHLAGYLHECI